jgi:hypothetical protein
MGKENVIYISQWSVIQTQRKVKLMWLAGKLMEKEIIM